MIPPNWGGQICPWRADLHVGKKIQGMTETEMCFQKTCFRFHQSLVNSEKNDPAKLGRANLPAAGRFARGQKKTNPAVLIKNYTSFPTYPKKVPHVFFTNTSREGLCQVYDGRSTKQIISIGNNYWGPLNQKKGGTLRGLRVYHSIDNETNPPQATTEMIISFTVMTYLQY